MWKDSILNIDIYLPLAFLLTRLSSGRQWNEDAWDVSDVRIRVLTTSSLLCVCFWVYIFAYIHAHTHTQCLHMCVCGEVSVWISMASKEISATWSSLMNSCRYDVVVNRACGQTLCFGGKLTSTPRNTWHFLGAVGNSVVASLFSTPFAQPKAHLNCTYTGVHGTKGRLELVFWERNTARESLRVLSLDCGSESGLCLNISRVFRYLPI